MPLKNTANQRLGFPFHILRYATGSIPLYYPFITRVVARKFCWGPFEDFSKISSETFQLLRTFTNSSDHSRKFSDSFRIVPKSSEDFQKIIKTSGFTCSKHDNC